MPFPRFATEIRAAWLPPLPTLFTHLLKKMYVCSSICYFALPFFVFPLKYRDGLYVRRVMCQYLIDSLTKFLIKYYTSEF